ncbi:MAG: CHASE2 domain-containing protein [Geitlerinemataceae cyanobacterium]
MKQSFGQQFKQELAIWRIGALPGLAAILLVAIARATGSLQFLEWSALDTFLRLRPAEPMDERIAIVGIDETDIEGIARYPIPDGEIAELLKKLQVYQPAVIGLDLGRELPVEPGHQDLKTALAQMENAIGVERVFPQQGRPAGLPIDRVGFSDFPWDADLHTRRSFLGMPNPRKSGDYKFSLAMQLARVYLSKTENLPLENGIDDRQAMRFGKTEFPRFLSHSGGYVGTDAGGVQVLLNFRSGSQPFRMLSLDDIETGNFDPNWLRDRIVLIGVTAPNYKSTIQTSALERANPKGLSGVEFQAHAASQILSAVLDGRTLLKTWLEGWEYLWILSWGCIGIILGHLSDSLFKNGLGIGLLGTVSIGIGYGSFLWGWWLPVVPSVLALVFGNIVYTAFSEYDNVLRSRLQERQRTIDRTFNVIHNGPLQTLANVLRHIRDRDWSEEKLLVELENLNYELRAVGERLEQEMLDFEDALFLGSGKKLDLKVPIHELFYEVYRSTLERDLPGFQTLKIKAIDFEPMVPPSLGIEQKRELCRFLEEALCNVGKHAIGATRLGVTGTQTNGWYLLRITDNGPGLASFAEGRGTKQSKHLKVQLKGKFKRETLSPRGTVCELTWPVARSWVHKLS